jgi:acylphosphatase
MADEVVCRRVLYHGQVQGVGFRFTAHRVARNFRVGGWVRNLPDGTVELIAAGPSAEVQAFLDQVRHQMARNIATVDESGGPDDVDLTRFEILH